MDDRIRRQQETPSDLRSTVGFLEEKQGQTKKHGRSPIFPHPSGLMGSKAGEAALMVLGTSRMHFFASIPQAAQVYSMYFFHIDLQE